MPLLSGEGCQGTQHDTLLGAWAEVDFKPAKIKLPCQSKMSQVYATASGWLYLPRLEMGKGGQFPNFSLRRSNSFQPYSSSSSPIQILTTLTFSLRLSRKIHN